MRNDFSSNYLMHHGILGMKWGQQNGPPYPLDAKDHSAAEKKAGWMKSLKAKSEAKKKEKKRKAALEKARKARAEKAKQEKIAKEYEENRQKILKSGKASEVARYKGQMTNQELRDALNRINWEKELDSYTAAETKTNFDKVNGFMNKAKDVYNWYSTGKNIYNAMADIHNTFSAETEEDLWPKIGGGDNDDVKKDKEEKKKKNK